MKYFLCPVPRIYGKWFILLLFATIFYVIGHYHATSFSSFLLQIKQLQFLLSVLVCFLYLLSFSFLLPVFSLVLYYSCNLSDLSESVEEQDIKDVAKWSFYILERVFWWKSLDTYAICTKEKWLNLTVKRCRFNV